MIDVLGTDEFEQWFLALNDDDSMAVARVVGLLEAKGTALGFPYSSALEGARYPLRELRDHLADLGPGHRLAANRCVSSMRLTRCARLSCCWAATRVATSDSIGR